MTNRRRRLAAMAALAVLTAGCPIDLVAPQAQLVNHTDDTVWYQLLASNRRTPAPAKPLEAGTGTRIGAHTDPCLTFDTLQITADDPAEVADPEILLEHDLQDQPVCEGERWVFNGQELVQSE